MRQTFYKDGDMWYIDLPQYIEQGGDIGDLQMVAGADTMLDLLSDNGILVTLDISAEERPHIMKLVRINEMGEGGADYVAHIHGQTFPVWLCAVTVYVFKEYPAVLFINKC